MRKRLFPLFNGLLLLIVGVYYLVLYFYPRDWSNPSQEYYVADYAGAFSSASHDHFLRQAQRVADLTEGSELGCFQIVTAAYAYPEGASDYQDKTALFRKWEIGENDMGLLLLYSYRIKADGTLSFFKNEVEVGYRLSSYLTAGFLGGESDADFAKVNSASDPSDLECAQAAFLRGILAHVLPEAYSIAVSPFDREAYQDYLISYDGKAYPPSVPLSQWDYVFTFTGNLFWAWGCPLVFLAVLLTGEGVFALGRGGSSGGGGIRRLFS
jgi:hypothetical protein